MPLVAKATKVKMIVLDVDGVLTDGGIIYASGGEEIKVFNVKDGLGLVQAVDSGLVTVIITGRESPAVARRAQELKITHLFQGVSDKLAILQKLCQELSISLDEVAYIGDDIPDLSVLQNVGLACCPNDAVPEVLAVCHFVTRRDGGRGAVREITDFILGVRSTP